MLGSGRGWVAFVYLIYLPALLDWAEELSRYGRVVAM